MDVQHSLPTFGICDDSGEKWLAEEEKSRIEPAPRRPSILFIDDDRSLGKIFAHLARNWQVQLTVCSSFDEFLNLKRMNFDAAIVDYDLGVSSPINGLDLARYMDISWPRMPIILTSALERRNHTELWPHSILRFVHKDAGAASLLETAMNFASK